MERFDDADIQNFIQGRVDDDEPRAERNESWITLNHVWVTEVHAPEILEYQQNLIDELKQQLTTQQTGVNQMMDLAGESGSANENFTASLYQMDIERVRYSLSRYLRTRLLKIENSLDYIIQNPEILNNRLSENEQHFAISLYNLTNRHFEEVIFNTHFENNPEFRERIESSDDRVKHSVPSFQVCINLVCQLFCHTI